MKLKSLLLLSIIPILLTIPNLAYGSEFYVETDRYGYTINDSILISGHAIGNEEDNNLTIIIYSPEGSLISISQHLVGIIETFEHSALAGGASYSNGTYRVTASYIGETVETSFEFNTEFVPEQTISQIQTNQSVYNYDDTVFVNGVVTEILTGYDIDVSVINPNGDVAYINTIQPNVDLTFDFSFDINSVLFENIGSYIINVTYGNGYSSVTFETPITNFFVETDKSQYFFEENIIISGEVDEPLGNISVTGLILKPDGNILTIFQTTSNEDRIFNYETSIPEIENITEIGIYTLRISYNELQTETTFEIILGSPLMIEIDQPQHNYNDTVFVNGTVSEIIDDELAISIITPNGIITYTYEITINEDLTFDMDFEIQGNLYDEIGIYTVEAEHGNYTASATFETLSSNLNILLDRDTYYEDDTIEVTGAIMEIDRNQDATIYYDVFDENNNIIELGSIDYPRNNDLFTFRIVPANNPQWDITGDMRIDVSIQNHTSTASFQYIHEPNMTNEALYEDIQMIYRILSVLTDNNVDQAKSDLIQNYTSQIIQNFANP